MILQFVLYAAQYHFFNFLAARPGFPGTGGQEKTGARGSGFFLAVSYLLYCPALATAGVIASGRLSSSVSSVPAINVAERCLLSQ